MDHNDWNEEFKGNPDHVDVADLLVVPEIRDLSPGTALDLGCGTGRIILDLARRGWITTGVDWADQAIVLARETAHESGLDATFIVADTTCWRPEAPFDLVVSTYALPGGEANRLILDTAAACVAPGGTIIIAEWDRSMAEVWPFDASDLTTPEDIVAEMAGLEIVRAGVQRIEVFAPDDPRAFAGTSASVAFVRAVRRL